MKSLRCPAVLFSRQAILVAIAITTLVIVPQHACPAPAAGEARARIRGLLEREQFAQAESTARALVTERQGSATSGRDAELALTEAQTLLAEALWRGGKAGQPEAPQLANRALETRIRLLGANHADVAASRNLLANVMFHRGEGTGAARLYELALTARERTLPADHPDLAESLHDYALFLRWRGDYAKSKSFLERALRIREKAVGADDLRTSSTRIALSDLLIALGDYPAARAHAERALIGLEKTLGPDHALVADACRLLARSLEPLGDVQGALAMLQRALGIEERAHGPGSPEVAQVLTELGNLLRKDRKWVEARPLLERALAIFEATRGPNHLDLAPCLHALAAVWSEIGDRHRADDLHKRALAIREKALGPDHPDVAASLILLSTPDSWSDKSSVDRLRRASAILEKTFGPESPQVAAVSVRLGEEYERNGNLGEALDQAMRAENISRRQLRNSLPVLEEGEALRFAASRLSGLDLAIRLALRSPDDSAVVTRVWDALVRSRALVLDEMAARHRELAESDDVIGDRLSQQLKQARQRLSNLLIRGAGVDSLTDYRSAIAAAQHDVEEGEQALARRSAAFRRELTRGRVGFAEMLESCPPRSAIVSFVRYRRPEKFGSVRYYAAFLLRSDDRHAGTVWLGRADEIDFLISRWLKEAGRQGMELPRTPDEGVSTYRAVATALRRKVWDMLMPSLTGVDRVFLCPDGGLNQVNFAALPNESGGYLLETGPLIHYLSTERDMVAAATDSVFGDGTFALGGPAFDSFGKSAPGALLTDRRGAAVAEGASSATAFRGMRSECADFRALRFTPLPGAAAEVNEISEIWSQRKFYRSSRVAGADSGLVRLTGTSASEPLVRKLAAGHGIVHLATHGFFLGGSCHAALDEPARAAGDSASARATARLGSVPENPLRLSGLALAGANLRDSAPAGEDDGILTAEEIGSLDLSGVRWAVLSACETGQGEIRSGEGVLGLRRAFQIAGAATVVMSLWSVEDEATTRWMKALFEERFLEGKGTAEAVRGAALALLADRRKKGESLHPVYWAAFIAAGDWK